MATLIESFAVVTRGPELIAGSMPIRRNKNGRNKPSVVATIIAENIAVPNAKTSRIGCIFPTGPFELSKIAQASPPKIPQLSATSRAIRASLVKT